MSVLFVGHYRENSGWANASQQLILAMDKAGIDVVPRSIKLSNVKGNVHPRILELEQKNNICDICIQQVLPHHMEYGRFKKNIAFPFYEFGNMKYSNWNTYISMMDEVWVSSKFTKKLLEGSGIKRPYHIVPIPYEDGEYNKIQKEDQNYCFYTIGDFNKRKNIRDTVVAYYREFSYNEPVSLYIKISSPIQDANTLQQGLLKDIDHIKSEMRLHADPNHYPDIFLITEFLNREDYLSLHATLDCFVTTSHGESWNIPLQEAILFNNPHIVPKGMYDYASKSYTYDTHTNAVCGSSELFFELGSSYETWEDIDIISLGHAMRQVYNDRYKSRKLDKIENQSMTNVGNQIKMLLRG